MQRIQLHFWFKDPPRPSLRERMRQMMMTA
jgi:hypothetical protein